MAVLALPSHACGSVGSYFQVLVAVLALPSSACDSVGSYLQTPVAVLGLTFRCLWQCCAD